VTVPEPAVHGPRETVWVLGDQLNRHTGALAGAAPATHRVLLVESAKAGVVMRWHRQRLHLVRTAMRRFAAELATEGFHVDFVEADDMLSGLRRHRELFRPDRVIATEPSSRRGRTRLQEAGVSFVPGDHFLCHPDEFAAWAHGRKQLRLEDFYRWQRRRLGYLMDGSGADAEPVEGRWNFDADNRQPPPKSGPYPWPTPLMSELDDVDRAVIEDLPETTWGADPAGWWATDRAGALERLDHFVDEVLPMFGPHEDAMLTDNWHLAHSALSPYLNLGLLTPREVCDRVDAAYQEGRVPISSAEGFIRQVIGWREYVWGLYWLWGPEYAEANELGAERPLPPVFHGATTKMRCVEVTLDDLAARGWAHHIQRLMILGNLALLTGVRPGELVEWMWASFVDGAEWVMLPNVIGMSQHADGGKMATKPYAAGGAYIDRMSNYCKGCHFDRKARTGERACPFTTLYWDFLARHSERFAKNQRMVTQVRAAEKLADLPAVRARAAEVLDMLDEGLL
jgi:deoxyribodipyrimidine photolyase-related protein